MKVGIIIRDRYRTCGGGKCFRSVRERAGGFARYAEDEPAEVGGYSTYAGCPGGNVEYVPEEMVENGADPVLERETELMATEEVRKAYN